MRIQLKASGGLAAFPGLKQSLVLESEELPREQAERLQQLVDQAHFFDLPALVKPPAPGAADYRQYTMTVDDGNRHHTVQAIDPVENPALQALLDFLRAYQK